MRLPRNLSGDELAAALRTLGYGSTRQTGSHMRLTTFVQGEHHVTIPRHSSLRVGTLSNILSEVERHHGLSRSDLISRLFGSD